MRGIKNFAGREHVCTEEGRQRKADVSKSVQCTDDFYDCSTTYSHDFTHFSRCHMQGPVVKV